MGCTAGTSALQFFWFLLAKCAVGTEGEPNKWDPNPWASLWAMLGCELTIKSSPRDQLGLCLLT